MSNIPDVSNSKRLTIFRYWLIKLIAGRSSIILNVSFDIVDQRRNEPVCLTDKFKGLYVSNVDFPGRNGKILSLTQRVVK